MAVGGVVKSDLPLEEAFDLFCTMCKHKDKKTKAVRFCTDCHDYYCLTCVKVHGEVPALMDHNILDKCAVGQEPPMVPTERCSKHKHKHIDMYCQIHDDVGCSTCMLVEHRNCSKLFSITDTSEFIKENTKPSEEFKNDLKSVSKILNDHTSKFQLSKENLLKHKSDLLEQVRKFRKEIDERLDKLEKNAIAEIEAKDRVLGDKIEGKLVSLQANKTDVEKVIDNIASKNTLDVFINLKIGKKVLFSAAKCIDETKNVNSLNAIEFEPNRNIQAFLGDIDSLGKITDKNFGTLNMTHTFIRRHLRQKQQYTMLNQIEHIKGRILNRSEEGIPVRASECHPSGLRRRDSFYS